MKRTYKIDDTEHKVDIMELTDSHVKYKLAGRVYHAVLKDGVLRVNEKEAVCHSGRNRVMVDGRDLYLALETTSRNRGENSAGGDMLSPMPGKILKTCLSNGDNFKAGDAIVIMEAMKMEHTIKATTDGKLISYLVNEGQLVEGGKELFEYEGNEL